MANDDAWASGWAAGQGKKKKKSAGEPYNDFETDSRIKGT